MFCKGVMGVLYVLFRVGLALALKVRLGAFGCIYMTALIGGLVVFASPSLEAQTIALGDNQPPQAAALSAHAATDRPLTVHVSFRLRHRQALSKLLTELQDPGSAQYHRWLTPQQFNQKFGRTPAEVQDVSQWLSEHGLRVIRSSNREVTYAATVAQAEETFATTIAASPDGAVFSNALGPRIPVRFADVIGSIDGLDNLRHWSPITSRQRSLEASSKARGIKAKDIAKKPTASLPAAIMDTAGSSPAFDPHFGPQDLWTFYDETPPINGAIDGGGGDCIAIVEDSDYLDAAVSTFDTNFSLPDATVARVFADTSSPGTNSDETEALLDIEWAHSTAPGVPIKVYIGKTATANIDPLTDSILKAVSDNSCGAISFSYVFCGAAPSFYSTTLANAFAQAATQGQSVFAASGDWGSAGLTLSGNSCVPATTPNVSETSADPNVTSVGGTQFTPNYDSSSNDVGNVSETAWSDSGATGGGKSAVFPKPSYQNSVTPDDRVRDVPDVALAASNVEPGFYWVDDRSGTATEMCCIGGTSLSTPVWASISKLIAEIKGSRLGSMNPRIYQLGALGDGSQSGLRDVVTGSNGYNGVAGFEATTGYDLTTGWGSPDVQIFEAAFLSKISPTPTSTATLVATPTPTSTATLSGTASATAKATSTQSPTPTPIETPTGRKGFVLYKGSHHSMLQMRPAVTAQAAAAPSSTPVNLMPKKAIKLAVSRDGWYRVPFATLKANGFNPLKGKGLHLYAEGIEQPLELNNNGVEFYGTGLDTPSTATRIYWLVNGAVSKDHIVTSTASGGANAGADFLASVELQDRNTYFPQANTNSGIDFFGDPVSATPQNETLTVAHLSSPGSAMLEVGVQGVSAGAHNVMVALNGVTLGAVTSFSDQGTGVATFSAPSIIEGANTVTLTASSSSPVDSLIDHITLTYERSYVADSDMLEFTTQGSAQVVVSGFTGSSVRMVDITQPSAPIELIVIPEGNGAFAATAPDAGSRTILAFGADQVLMPDSISLHKPSKLTPLAGRVDTVIITTAELVHGMQPLVKQRAKQKLHVKVVDIAQVYDAFSFGEKDPQAIKSFLAATRSGKHAPHYLMLTGDASYDPRNFLGLSSNQDLVPTKLVNTTFGQAANDGWFSDFAGDLQPQMATGRLPVETATDLAKLINKIIAYDKVTPSTDFLLASDASDGTPTFASTSAALATLLPAIPTLITRDPVTDNHATLIGDINAAPDLVNFVGHGTEDTWSQNSSWLSDLDVSSLTNSGHPAFFVLMTCLNGDFADPTRDSLAASLLLANGGAVAVWASSGLTVPSGQLEANQALYQQLFGSSTPPALGEAVRQAKLMTSDPDVKQTWNLLGDPETQLR
jgi:kumamolisin